MCSLLYGCSCVRAQVQNHSGILSTDDLAAYKAYLHRSDDKDAMLALNISSKGTLCMQTQSS